MAVDPVGLTGLIIALVALAIALFQMMQALFATADGYRNCRPAVMGDWGDSKLTKRKFVPGEFRFETIYHVPFITVGGFRGGESSIIDGTPISRERTHCKMREQGWWKSAATTSEMVTWVFLIDQLHRLGAACMKLPDTVSAAKRQEKGENEDDDKRAPTVDQAWLYPTLSTRQRSWDFTPPDINKPLAVTNVGSIAVIVRRLGMTWTQFQPLESNLRAEGNGMIIESTKVPSVGTIIQFNRAQRENYDPAQNEVYIAKEDVDMLGFGMIRPWLGFGSAILSIGSDSECIDFMREFFDERHDRGTFSHILNRNSRAPGLAELVPLCTATLYSKGSGITGVPQPSQYAAGMLATGWAPSVLEQSLKSYISTYEDDLREEDLKQLRRLMDIQNDLLTQRVWRSKKPMSAYGRNPVDRQTVATLDQMYDCMREAEEWLRSCNVDYADLVLLHLNLAFKTVDFNDHHRPDASIRTNNNDNSDSNNNNNNNNNRNRNNNNQSGGENLERVRRYFSMTGETLHDQTGLVRYAMDDSDHGVIAHPNDPKHTRGALATAWYTMIFRGICWHRLHHMVRGPTVGSEYWDSKLSIYIT